MRETLGRMLGDDARPIDVGMLVIELLVLALIAVEVVWNGKDRFLNWRERKHDERRMLQQLALLSATESAALRALLLSGMQPSEENAQWLMSKVHWAIARDSVSWYIPNEHIKL